MHFNRRRRFRCVSAAKGAAEHCFTTQSGRIMGWMPWKAFVTLSFGVSVALKPRALTGHRRPGASTRPWLVSRLGAESNVREEDLDHLGDGNKEVTEAVLCFSRRDLCHQSLLSAALLVSLPGVSYAEESPMPLSSLRRRFFAKMDARTKAENMRTVYSTYSPAFVAYLSRILLSYDPPSKEWWNSVLSRLKTRYDTDIRQVPALESFRDYVTSVQVGLEGFEGEKGILRLFKLLVLRYGGMQDAEWQIAVLFSLLEPELQPVDEISTLLSKLAPLEDVRLQEKGVASPGTTASAVDESSSRTFVSALKTFFGGSPSNVVRLLTRNDVDVELAYVDDDGVVRPVPPPPKTPPKKTNASAIPEERSFAPSFDEVSPTTLAANALPIEDEDTFYRLALRKQGVASKVYVPPPPPFSTEYESSLESVLAVDSFGGDLRKLRKDVTLSNAQAARFFAAGALCSSFARVTLTPIDVIKTTIQADSDGGAVLPTIKSIWERSGIKGFFAGADSTFVGYFFAGATAFGLTELLKRKIGTFLATSSLLGNGFGLGQEWVTNNPVPITITAAALGVVASVVVVMPFEAVRIRAVSAPKFRGKNLLEVGEVMLNDEGFASFFTGLPFFFLKDVPFFVIKFVIFDAVAGCLYEVFPAGRELASISLLISLTAGLVAGGTAAIITHPFDSLITLVNVKSSEKQARGGSLSAPKAKIAGQSPFALVMDDFRKEGLGWSVQALARGVVPRFGFAALVVSMQFFLYDFFKISFKISSADLTLFWDVLGGVAEGVSPG